MDLSVIIVSYNVKYYLEQCLFSVLSSAKGINTEIIVVDNNSVDGSCHLIRHKFPSVKLISNQENNGFAKACNQGIRTAGGRYILLLNPDTLVQEDTFGKCIAFMDKNADAGCMGVKMIDGAGNYLPESKRALPTPNVAFFKIFGLTALFPSSRTFGRYYLGHLDKNRVHEIEVLTGAFMFIRRSVLDKAGLLDEDYFMYGEDIDLSYRIKQAGYKIFYYPGTTIIHYKGESTRKASFNYVYLFYNAMIIFAGKHFSGQSARPLIFLIHLAIYFRAALSLLQRVVISVINPIADAAAIWAGYYFFLPVWERAIFGINGTYPAGLINIMLPAYILVWIISIYLNGGYEKNVRIMSLVKGIVAGSLLILLVYALLPETMRFSRALILIGSVWAIMAVTAIRSALNFIDPQNFGFDIRGKKKVIVLTGSMAECQRVAGILRGSEKKHEIKGFVAPDSITAGGNDSFLGHLGQMRDIVFVNQVDEVIFCSRDLPSKEIIKTMLMVSDYGVSFKIAAPDSLSIIGSRSVNSAGDFYSLYSDTLSEPVNRTRKRLFDISTSILLFVLSPVMVFIIKNPGGLLRNIFTTLSGLTTWVGFCSNVPGNSGLPALRKGIITPADAAGRGCLTTDDAERLNLTYARDYSPGADALIILRSFQLLGRVP